MGALVNPFILAAPGGGGGGSLPLDALQSSYVAAFSFWRLFSDYVGPCMRVKRRSDSTETDIGFDTGFYDIAAAETFRGSSTLDVVQWYSQAPGGFDAICTHGAEILNPSDAATIYAKALTDYPFEVDPAVFGSATAATGYALLKGEYPGWANFGDYSGWVHTPHFNQHCYDAFFASSRPDVCAGYAEIADAFHLHVSRNTGSRVYVYRDGTSLGDEATDPVSLPLAQAHFPASYSGWNASCDYREFAVLGSALSDADRQLIEGSALWRCGRQIVLPGGHPYAGAPP